MDNIASPSVRGLTPTDAFWRTTIRRPNFRSPRLPIAFVCSRMSLLRAMDQKLGVFQQRIIVVK